MLWVSIIFEPVRTREHESKSTKTKQSKFFPLYDPEFFESLGYWKEDKKDKNFFS